MKKLVIVVGILAIVLVVFAIWLLSPASDNPNANLNTSQNKTKQSVQKPQGTPVEKSNQLSGVIRPNHIVIVIEENHSYEQLIGNKKAPYMNSLFKSGALMTNSHGVKHPSQPNYLAIFSGDSHGITSDGCPHTFSTENLATQLVQAGKSFAGYSEDLPTTGFTGCSSGKYERKHNPWVNFTNVSPKVNLPFSAFPKDFTKLPTVSFVIPNLNHDIHDGTIMAADKWLKSNLQPYIEWAKTHNSLLILTWDEDDFRPANHIPTDFVGPMVKQGKYGEYINHYNVLRTIQALYDIGPLGNNKNAPAITNIWK